MNNIPYQVYHQIAGRVYPGGSVTYDRHEGGESRYMTRTVLVSNTIRQVRAGVVHANNHLITTDRSLSSNRMIGLQLLIVHRDVSAGGGGGNRSGGATFATHVNCRTCYAHIYIHST